MEQKIHASTLQRKVSDGSRTEFIRFDSGKCKACWECIKICPENVFGKINIIIHKHAKIVNGSYCKGCMKCIKACGFGAIISLK